MNKIKAVLFDLDGTLVNSIYSLQDTMNKTMAHFGLDSITEAQTKQYVGDGYQAFVERSLAATAERLYREAEKWERKDEDRAFELDQQADEVMENFDDACDYYLSIFPENCCYRADAYPGMKEALAALREQGLKLGCVTNKPMVEAEKVLDQVFGKGYFDYISADDGSHPLKPDPGVIFDACAHLSVEKEACVFVGDTKTDMDAAAAAKVPAIGCVYGFRGRKELQEHGAAALIETAAELVETVKALDA